MKSRYHFLLPEVEAALASPNFFTAVKKHATRYSYSESLMEVAEINPKVVVLDVDVGKSLKTNEFAKKYPHRSFNFGIAEQNMMASAAGMATTGLIPFASGYAMFLSMRALDQVRNSVHYPHLNVKIAASHSGITPGPDGVTHQAQEDLSIIRTIAGSCVIAPADHVTTKMAVHAMTEYDGPVYLSLTRDPVPYLYTPDYPFEIGRMVTLREGNDLTIIANRDLVAHALVAAAQFSSQGIEARVLDCHTIKPLDEEAVLKAARETGCIVTAENNVIFGGLGSAVAELLVENDPIPMQRIGVRDTFAESGPYYEVIDKYGLTYPHIIQAAQKVLNRKYAFNNQMAKGEV